MSLRLKKRVISVKSLILVSLVLLLGTQSFGQPAPQGQPGEETPVPTTRPPEVPNVDLVVPQSRFINSVGISPRLGVGWAGVFPLNGSGQTLTGNAASDLGASLGVRLAAADGVEFMVDWRIMTGIGNGLRYASFNFRTFRFRWALDRHQNFWAAVSPLDMEAQFASNGSLRNRFGWRPTALIGVIRPLGDSKCQLHIFAQGGFSLGTQQTRDATPNGVFQPLVGAEALVACQRIRVDVQYEHLFGMNFRGEGALFNGTDVDRLEIDSEARFRLNRSVSIGPFVNVLTSFDRADSAAAVGTPSNSNVRQDEMTVIVQGGARLTIP